MFLKCMSKTSIYTKCTKLNIPATCLLQTSRYYSVDTSKIVRSIIPDINIPKMFLDDYIWQKLDNWGNKTALQCAETGRSYLYSQVYKKSRALSCFLRNKIPSIKEQDTVAIILPNVPEYPIILLGIIQAGLKATTVNSNYKSDEIYKQLLNSETKFVFTVNELWPQVNQAIQRLKSVIPVAVVKHKEYESLPAGSINFNEIVEGNIKDKLQTNRSLQDVIILPYSSGTTGLPKGVELTHKNIVANLSQVSVPEFKLINNTQGSSQEVLPGILPWYHIYGLVVVLLNGLASGSKLIVVPKFKPETFIDVLKCHRPTVAYLAPPTVLFLLNSSHVTSELLMQMKCVISGAAPLGADDINRLRDKSKRNTNFIQMYGLTETSPITHSQTPYSEHGIVLGGAGLSVPNTECLIIPTDSQEKVDSGLNVTGELLIRGPQIMKGYYKNSEATRNSIDKDGFLRTGDIAFFDKHGHLFVTGRIKELIKVKGFQVAPAELEEILRGHPDVEDAAVIGIPDSRYGEVPKAFLVPKSNVVINTLKIKEYVAAKVAEFKQLKGGVVIIGNIPKSAAGKILRQDLKML